MNSAESRTSADLQIRQPRNGYRFSQDALLLSDFVVMPPRARVVDLGTGCGVIALRLARMPACSHVFGVELQPELARLAEENVQRNDLHQRITIRCQDMRSLELHQLGGAAHLVVSNPPFRRLLAGRLNPDSQSAVANHELCITLDELLVCAKRLLGDRGRLALIYSSERLGDLMVAMRDHQLEPKRLQMVHARVDQAAQRVLMEGIKNGGSGLRVMPPLVLDPQTPVR